VAVEFSIEVLGAVQAEKEMKAGWQVGNAGLGPVAAG